VNFFALLSHRCLIGREAEWDSSSFTNIQSIQQPFLEEKAQAAAAAVASFIGP
jgi:hypothetical protein